MVKSPVEIIPVSRQNIQTVNPESIKSDLEACSITVKSIISRLESSRTFSSYRLTKLDLEEASSTTISTSGDDENTVKSSSNSCSPSFGSYDSPKSDPEETEDTKTVKSKSNSMRVELDSSSSSFGSYGSMRKEKEWKRTLACKLFEERRSLEGGGEGMDSLWEAYEEDNTNKKSSNSKKKTSVKNNKKAKSEFKYFDDGISEDGDEDDEFTGNAQLCCLKALKMSTGKMNLGMGKPNLVKFSKALKGFIMVDTSVMGYSFNSKGAETVRRSVLALKSDPLKPRFDQIRKQADDHRSLALAYSAYARKLKLENSKLVRVFADLSRSYMDLVGKPDYKALFDSEGERIDEGVLRQFEKEVKERIKVTRQVIAEAKESFDNQLKIQKLKDTIFAVNEQLTKSKKQGAFSSLIAAKSIPKSLHCVTMKLMEERIAHPDKYTDEGKARPVEFDDPNLYHYAIFSDNVVAASVVVNSAVKNTKEPWKHVFHVVTDKMNLGAMQVMFKMKEYNGAHIEVKAVEDYKFLNSSYVPVLKQLESASLLKFYFENKLENATKDTTNMKFRNPKYLSILNHLRFYLPEMYPTLHRILFLDDDIIVQKDLTGLWKIDMDGKVNGAVETCFGSFHRYSQYMNFSHPLIKEKFNPKACAWAYGMNFFDLDAWRREKCTEEYHYWQNLNENRTLWKLGTLPPGLITFYSTTKPLEKSWHVLGLGYNPSISMEEIRNAAVVHFNGNMKPWLDIAMNQFRPLWTKYVDYDMEFVQACNFGH
ncbi:Glycosyl transferase, family 8 [Artemisia annua]|uniref:Glycosyl transferase, family 8 n=1 Tax=Artemisia annua TaxID=35608 RepID=A0A2U1MVM7_ARTAN|nr:Glycosyl transferase, family 8 [Artemisia annua]